MSNKIAISIVIICHCILLFAQEVKLTSTNIETPFDVDYIIEQISDNRVVKQKSVFSYNEWWKADEFIIDTSVVYIPAYHEQNHASVVFGGDYYFVVWADSRCDPDYNYHSLYSYDIYGARVDTAGTVLDPAGIAISIAPFKQTLPTVSFDGTNYFVVWQDYRNTGAGPYDIYGARVDTAGTVLDPSGFAISTATNNQQNPAVTFDGMNYLVVWQDDRSGSHDIYGTRVKTDGSILDPGGIIISSAPNAQCNPSVVFQGTNYFVVWDDYRSGLDNDIYGARVDTAGIVLDPLGFTISTAANNQAEPSVAFDGTNCFVVWHDQRGVSLFDIYGARVDTSGTVLDPSGFAISTAVNSENCPSVFFDGINYLVAWQVERMGPSHDIFGTRVDTSGNVLDPSGIAISTDAQDEQNPSVFSDGTKSLVVWHSQHSFSSYDVCGVRVNHIGTVIDSGAITISTTANDQWHSSVAFDGTHYLVVWHDRRNGSYDIYGARVDTLGTILDPTGITISVSEREQKYPSVACDGTHYLVVWQIQGAGSSYDIYGVRIDTAGSVLDSMGIAVSTAVEDQLYPSVIYGGENYLVVWQDHREGNRIDIYGARIDTSGSVLDSSGIVISTCVEPYHYYPSVAFGGSNYLVVWYTFIPIIDEFEIFGTRLDLSGTVLDPKCIDISPYTDDELYPSVAFDGTNYVVVWSYICFNGYNIYGARVDTSGTVLDTLAIPITTGNYFQYYPSIVFDSTNYVIVWEEWPSGHLYSNIYGAEVTPQMQVVDTFTVSLQSGNQYLPIVTHGTGNQKLITFAGFTDDINGTSAHTMRVWGKLYPSLGIEEDTEFNIQKNRCMLRVYPNPFSQLTAIHFDAVPFGTSTLKIYDVTGRIVRQFSDTVAKGSDCIIWKGDDDSGFRLPAGIYFILLTVDNFSMMEKVILLE